MDPALLAILGMLIGLALLVIEFFIPSGGLILVLACISLLSGVWGAWKAWGQDDPSMFATYLGLMVLLIPGAVGGGLYILNNTALGDRVLLRGPTPDEVAGLNTETEKLRTLVGSRGKTLSLLNPGGLVLVDGTRYHCESRGMMIEPQTEVEVLDVDGTRLVVRVPSEGQTRQDTDSESEEVRIADASDSTSEGFDFEIPEETA